MVGWGGRDLRRAWPVNLCTVSRELLGDGENPSHPAWASVQKGTTLELRSSCRGQNRGGWGLEGAEGPVSALPTGQTCSLSPGGARPPASPLPC